MPEQQPDKPNANHLPYEERRASERFACDRSSFWSAWGGHTNESMAARLYNISATGLCLMTPTQIRPGKILVIRVLSETRGLSPPLVVRIIHSTRQADGQWLSGGAFVRRLSDNDLDAILEEGQPG